MTMTANLISLILNVCISVCFLFFLIYALWVVLYFSRKISRLLGIIDLRLTAIENKLEEIKNENRTRSFYVWRLKKPPFTEAEQD